MLMETATQKFATVKLNHKSRKTYDDDHDFSRYGNKIFSGSLINVNTLTTFGFTYIILRLSNWYS